MHQIIRGGRLLDIDGHSAAPADILITDGVIREIGPPGLAAPEGADVVDASDRLLMAGLINGHTHGHGSLAKGCGDRWSLELLLNAGPAIGGNRTLEDKQLAATLNAMELVAKGCTAAYDLYHEFPTPTADGLDAVANGYAAVGMRAVIAPMMADASFFEAIPGLMDALPKPLQQRVEALRLAPFTECLAACKTALDGWRHDRDHLRLALAPTIPLHCSDDFITASGHMAADYDLGLHMHLAESRPQAVAGIKRYGHTLTAHLDALGFLSPRFTGAHGVWLDDDDLARLADNGCGISHNPGSNLRLGSGIARARAMLDRGVRLGIGTDGASCSDHQNMFEAMRLASFVSRVDGPDPAQWLSTGEVLRAATEGSADLLGLGHLIGRIALGYQADIVFLDLGHLNFIPFNDPVHQIVHSEDSGGVHSVMVAGRMVYQDRRHTRVDLGQIRGKVEAAVERLRAANAGMRDLAQQLEGVVGRFCIGMAAEPYHLQRVLAPGATLR